MTLAWRRPTQWWSVCVCAASWQLSLVVPLSGQCVEKRAFYRLISGLHASINIHLSARYLLDGETCPSAIYSPHSFQESGFSLRRNFYGFSDQSRRLPPVASTLNSAFLLSLLTTPRQLVSEEVGSQRVRVQAAFRFGADGRRGAQEAAQPLLPVPDRAAGAGQSSAVLPAAVIPAVHGPTGGGPEAQGAAAAHPAAGQVSPRPGADTRTGCQEV